MTTLAKIGNLERRSGLAICPSCGKALPDVFDEPDAHVLTDDERIKLMVAMLGRLGPSFLLPFLTQLGYAAQYVRKDWVPSDERPDVPDAPVAATPPAAEAVLPFTPDAVDDDVKPLFEAAP